MSKNKKLGKKIAKVKSNGDIIFIHKENETNRIPTDSIWYNNKNPETTLHIEEEE